MRVRMRVCVRVSHRRDAAFVLTCCCITPRRGTRQRLKLLSCSSCSMEGAIPDTIASLSHLQWLSLDRNRFTSVPKVRGCCAGYTWRLKGYPGTVVLASAFGFACGNLANVCRVRVCVHVWVRVCMSGCVRACLCMCVCVCVCVMKVLPVAGDRRAHGAAASRAARQQTDVAGTAADDDVALLSQPPW